MAECIQCGSYTKFEKGLCYECYQEKRGIKSTSEDLVITDKDISKRFNNIKGRIAETLIQELFLTMGYNVFNYGMENTIPGIMKLLKNVRSDVANDIRRIACGRCYHRTAFCHHCAKHESVQRILCRANEPLTILTTFGVPKVKQINFCPWSVFSPHHISYPTIFR